MHNIKKLILSLLAFASISFASMNDADNQLLNRFLNKTISNEDGYFIIHDNKRNEIFRVRDLQSIKDALDRIAQNDVIPLKDKYTNVNDLFMHSPSISSENYLGEPFTPEEKQKLMRLTRDYVTKKYLDYYHRSRLFQTDEKPF